jgi:hypothetical protein
MPDKTARQDKDTGGQGNCSGGDNTEGRFETTEKVRHAAFGAAESQYPHKRYLRNGFCDCASFTQTICGFEARLDTILPVALAGSLLPRQPTGLSTNAQNDGKVAFSVVSDGSFVSSENDVFCVLWGRGHCPTGAMVGFAILT